RHAYAASDRKFAAQIIVKVILIFDLRADDGSAEVPVVASFYAPRHGLSAKKIVISNADVRSDAGASEVLSNCGHGKGKRGQRKNKLLHVYSCYDDMVRSDRGTCRQKAASAQEPSVSFATGRCHYVTAQL